MDRERKTLAAVNNTLENCGMTGECDKCVESNTQTNWGCAEHSTVGSPRGYLNFKKCGV